MNEKAVALYQKLYCKGCHVAVAPMDKDRVVLNGQVWHRRCLQASRQADAVRQDVDRGEAVQLRFASMDGLFRA